jgi:hypothetical protein
MGGAVADGTRIGYLVPAPQLPRPRPDSSADQGPIKGRTHSGRVPVNKEPSRWTWLRPVGLDERAQNGVEQTRARLCGVR